VGLSLWAAVMSPDAESHIIQFSELDFAYLFNLILLFFVFFFFFFGGGVSIWAELFLTPHFLERLWIIGL